MPRTITILYRHCLVRVEGLEPPRLAAVTSKDTVAAITPHSHYYWRLHRVLTSDLLRDRQIYRPLYYGAITVGGKTVTETKPGYTKEKAQALIKKSIEEKAPQDLAEKQSLDFADFLSGLGG